MSNSENDALLDVPDMSDIHLAHARIREQIRHTPVIRDSNFDQLMSCQLFVKCEHLQRTGAFKFRGASHAVARLREDGIKGHVATHSSGNHGAALALAARLDGREAHVVMPDNASPVKIQAVKQNGGIVHLCKPTQADREAGLADLVSGGYLPIPPYDHVDIIAGQGTACLELLQQVPDLDVVIAPVGGGGLIGGTAIVAHDRGVKVYAAEPEGAADTAESFATGERAEHWKPETICDGLRAIVGVRNFALIRRFVGDVITADDGQTRQGMLWFWQQLRMLIEPSSAVALAAIKSRPDLFAGRRVGVIITGANIDPEDWLSLVGGLQSE